MEGSTIQSKMERKIGVQLENEEASAARDVRKDMIHGEESKMHSQITQKYRAMWESTNAANSYYQIMSQIVVVGDDSESSSCYRRTLRNRSRKGCP